MNRHTIFLIEDDADIAHGLTDLFRMMDWNTIVASTLDEFRQRAREGGYCLAIHDLEIPASTESIKAHVDAGLVGIQEHRARYPRCNDDGLHLLPMLCMSAFARDHRNGRKARRAGVDDAVVKPLDDNDESLVDTVKRLLRESGREDHARCEELTGLARRDNSTAPPTPALNASAAVRIGLPGTVSRRNRTVVLVNDRPVDVTHTAFYVLLRLVEGRVKELGYVSKEALGATEGEGFRGMSVMQDQLGPYVNGAKLYESIRGKGYALAKEVVIETIDLQVLAKHDEKRVRDVATALAKPVKSSRRA
jgi:DNA-binding response OmpR family regulator